MDEVAGAWYYAVKDVDGSLAPSTAAVGSLDPAELEQMPKGLRPPIDPRAYEPSSPRKLGAEKSLVHTQYVLTILVNYNDVSFSYSDASFQTLMYGASSSVKDFYLENSYNNFTVTPANETYGTSNDSIVHLARGINHPDLGSPAGLRLALKGTG